MGGEFVVGDRERFAGRGNEQRFRASGERGIGGGDYREGDWSGGIVADKKGSG